MILKDQSPASLALASALSIGLLLTIGTSAVAADPIATTGVAANAPATLPAPVAPTPLTVTVQQDGAETSFTTSARTVGDLLIERGIRVGPGDDVTPDTSAALYDGAHITLRTAQPVELRVGSSIRVVHTAALTVADLLRSEHIAVGRSDRVMPALDTRLAANQVVRVVRVTTWIAHERTPIAVRTVERTDATMPNGQKKILAVGVPGIRETTLRYTRNDDAAPVRHIVASRVIREPQQEIIVRGTATDPSLARVASQGFESALHFAGKALHVIATAYTAGCYGCSGITASGVRAGFGIIAVDPSVIPLGTKVFIPGYGRAVAGDTGGAILGNRVDLGMNSEAAAIQFGRRPVTVYVLR